MVPPIRWIVGILPRADHISLAPVALAIFRPSSKLAFQTHFLHHRYGDCNFAVVDNFWDWLLGTYRSIERQVLLDLIEMRGERDKWFAAVKDAGFLDFALLCAWDYTAEPATFVRAARDFAAKEPKFAAQIGVIALGRVLDGSGHDLEVSLVQEAFSHLTDAASRLAGCGKTQCL
jgi:hypothetical protein